MEGEVGKRLTQRMIDTSRIVPNTFRRPRTHEYASGVLDKGNDFFGVLDLEYLSGGRG